MNQFLEAALGFPAAIFSFLLIVVIGYWLVVLLGLIDLDTPDGDTSDTGTGFLGLGGVPVGVTFSFLVALSWLGCLVGSVLLHRESVTGTLLTGLSIALLIGALVVAWMVTKLLIRPLRYMLPDEKVPSRRDFIGRMCVIRTGRVDLEFGQATVRAADGSLSTIQVRQMADSSEERTGHRNQDAGLPLKSGGTALIFEYDADGQFFWVTPYDAALDPDRRDH